MTQTDPQTPAQSGFDPRQRRAIFAEELAAAGITRSVLVTGSFRAGTSYICTVLGNNGLTGCDQERFAGFWQLGPEASESDFRTALREVFASAEGGIFSCKLMWPHRNFLALALGFGRMESGGFAALFPRARWIDIRRRDKFSQAISFWKAKKTNRWHVFKDEAEPDLAYDYKAIRKAYHELSTHDLLWEDFHVAAQTKPYRIVYEEFLAQPEASLQGLLAALGPDHRRGHPPLTLQSQLRRQGNDQSREIRARFLADLYAANN